MTSYKLTTDHAASSYGQPVLVRDDGIAFGASDKLHTTGNSKTAGDHVRDQIGSYCITHGDDMVRRFLQIRNTLPLIDDLVV